MKRGPGPKLLHPLDLKINPSLKTKSALGGALVSDEGADVGSHCIMRDQITTNYVLLFVIYFFTHESYPLFTQFAYYLRFFTMGRAMCCFWDPAGRFFSIMSSLYESRLTTKESTRESAVVSNQLFTIVYQNCSVLVINRLLLTKFSEENNCGLDLLCSLIVFIWIHTKILTIGSIWFYLSTVRSFEVTCPWEDKYVF